MICSTITGGSSASATSDDGETYRYKCTQAHEWSIVSSAEDWQVHLSKGDGRKIGQGP